MMPLGFNMSQVFEMLMAKTMWDVKLGNTPFSGGFMGGNIMNSCFGSGFPQMNLGDSFNFNGAGAYNFNNAGTSLGGGGGTAEERTERRISQNKFNTLKGIINDYIKTLKENSEERILLEEKLKDCGSYSAEHYEDLKDLYNENKTKIQAKLKSGTAITETTKKAADNVAKALNATNPSLKTVLKVDSENKTTADLANGIDAVGLLSSLQTTKKKSYKALYDSAKASDKTELDKLTKALYANLSTEASRLKSESALSEETKKVLTDLSSTSANEATVENVDQMYYWVRKAKAEINNSKYENLQEDFPNDPLLGASNSVEETEKALKAEGLNSAAIEKATVRTDYSSMDSSEAVKSLEDKGMLKKLTNTQFAGVRQYLPNGVKQAWYDTNSRNNYQTIRFIDENGDLKCLYNIAVVKGKIQRINNKEVKVGEGLTPEKIEAVSKKLDEISASGAFTPRKASYGERVFEENKVIKGKHFKRLFKVDTNGELREWVNARYDARTDSYKKVQSNARCSLGEPVSIDDIKNAEANNVNTNNTAKKQVDPNAANYAQTLYKMDKSTPDILLNKNGKGINKDNIVDILESYYALAKDSNHGIYYNLCSASGSRTSRMSRNVVNRVPKALMRKAYELKLTGTDAYQTMAKYFNVKGTPKYDANGKVNIEDSYSFEILDGEFVAHEISPESREAVDIMIKNLYNAIQKKLNQS